jgi:membrane associated rhomboid family serine protease
MNEMRELTDTELETIAGGWNWSTAWHDAGAGAIIGGAIGATTGNPGLAGAAALGGAVWGFVIGGLRG